MLLQPPGRIPVWPQRLPHWPYVQAVDDATDRGILPGMVRADRTPPQHGETMYMILAWDVALYPYLAARTARALRAWMTCGRASGPFCWPWA